MKEITNTLMQAASVFCIAGGLAFAGMDGVDGLDIHDVTVCVDDLIIGASCP